MEITIKMVADPESPVFRPLGVKDVKSDQAQVLTNVSERKIKSKRRSW